MRLSVLLTLSALCLAGGALRATAARPPRNPPPQTVAAAPEQLPAVEAHGADPDHARRVALDKARDRVLLYLNERRLHCEPTASYMEQRGVLKCDEPEPVILDGESFYRARVSITIGPRDLAGFAEMDRQGRVWQRQLLLGRVLLGLLVLCAVVAGYLRLEETTQGYYTRWLRVAAVALVVLVGGGLLWAR